MTLVAGPPVPAPVTARASGSPVAPRRPGEQAGVGLLALASAAGALAAGLHPTASRPADVALSLLFGAGVVILASLARPGAWLAMTALATAATTGAWALIAAAAATGSAIATRRAAPRPHPIAGALVGTIVVQALLHMPPDRFGVNLAVATALMVGLTKATWPAMTDRTRGWVRRTGLVVGVAVGVAMLGLVASLVLSRQSLQRGIAGADRGLDAARAGQGSEAANQLEVAGRTFASAHTDLDAWWTRPALLLPGVGQHVRALGVLTEEGAHLATASAVAARSARLEDIRVSDGRLDLQHVRSMETPLGSIREALGRAGGGVERAESPWLVAPVAQRVADFQRSIDAATDDAATASAALAVLPDLLGGDGRRTYFVAFGTPAEARDLGGFMGAYAILQAEGGELSLRSTGRVRNLNLWFAGGQLTDPDALPDHFRALLPQKFWQNLTATPDFPTLAEALRQLWRPTDQPFDGVLYMDPKALATMLELTGPIRLDGYDTALTADTAAAFLLRDQYIKFPNEDRKDFLEEATSTVFTALTSGDLPGPSELADTLAPALDERRLLFHSFHPEEQALFERLHIDGSLPPVRGDFLSVRASNRGRSKIDAFMQRTVSYDVTVDPRAGTARATVTVRVQNEAPSTGLPYSVIGTHLDRPSGTNSTTVSVYTPLELVDVTVNGKSVGRSAYLEYDRNRYSALVDIPPGGERTVTFALEGTMDLTDGYHLDVVPQPLVNNDRVRVTVHGPAGWGWGGRFAAPEVLQEDLSVDVGFLTNE